MREMLKDSSHLWNIINHDYQTVIMSYPESRESSNNLFKVLRVRDPINIEASLLDMVVSHYPIQRYLSSNYDQTMLHILRKHHTLKIENRIFDFATTDFIEALDICDEKVRDFSLLTTKCDQIVMSSEKINYTRYVYLLPRELKFLKKEIYFTTITDWMIIKPNISYISSDFNIIRNVKLDDKGRIMVSESQYGQLMPKITTYQEMIEEIDIRLLYEYNFNNLMINEEERKTEIYVNFTTKKRLLKSEVKSDLLQTEFNMEDEMEFLLSAKLEGFEELENMDDQGAEYKTIEGLDDMLKTTQTDEYIKVSLKINSKWGFLIDPTWTLESIISESLIKRLVAQRVVTQDSTIDVTYFNLNYMGLRTFDKEFVNKFNKLLFSSKISIQTSRSVLTPSDYRDHILAILNDDLNIDQIINLLLNKVSVISFSHNPIGDIIDHDSFIDSLNLVA